jgi:hypothetical protein
MENKSTRANNRHKSLNVLNAKALKLDFTVALRVFQKFIKKKDVSPILSQPKNNVKRLFDSKSNSILKIKLFSQKIK